MTDNRSKHGIAFKLIFHILLFCAVTGTLASGYIFMCSRKIALENLDQKLASLARSSAQQVDGELRRIEDYTKGIANVAGLLRPSPLEIGALIEERVVSMPDVFGVAIGLEPKALRLKENSLCYNAFREKGIVRLLNMPFSQFDYFQRAWYRAARSGCGWTSPYVNAVKDAEGNDIMIVSCFAPILDPAMDNRFSGAVCTDLDIALLGRIAELARLDGDCDIIVLDRQTRRFVIYPDAEKVRTGATLDPDKKGMPVEQRALLTDLLNGREGRGLFPDLRSGESRRIYFLPLKRADWTLGVVYDEAKIMSGINALMLQTLLIALFSFAALTLLVRRSARRIIAPLLKLDLAAQEIACGKLNATLPAITEENEVGRLCASVRTMSQGLTALVTGIQRSTVRLVSASSQIAATSGQQERTMNDFEGEVSSVAAAVAEITASARALAGTMQEVNERAGNAAGQAGAGRESLQALERSMRTLTNATMSMAGKLELIRQSVENISGIVGAIAEVAEQTNLLSLNAAIEAEKAGEYGKGFSVVAREIRRLSDKTSVATLEIGQVAAGMQTAVEAGVAELELFTETVSRSAAEAAQIGDGLGEVIVRVTGLRPEFLRVNEGMQAQAQGAMEISEAMRRLRSGAEGAVESMNQLNSATEQLREAAAVLREEAARFQTGATYSIGGEGSEQNR